MLGSCARKSDAGGGRRVRGSEVAMVRPMILKFALGVVGALLCTCIAFAHVTLETAQAQVGSGYKAVLRVGHGCEGSPTTAIRVRIPEGIVAVKPMPKPGWKLEVVTGKYPKTYNLAHGVKMSEGVTEISWSGGNLPEAFYDEFVFTATIADDMKPDRKSTRLNSSHTVISYAVFCLKKKTRRELTSSRRAERIR